ncbi:phosphotransferase [Kouleothrix sp.]|uniref:phosphotransferase n=1 Tax=Kouleothrix sp. TaxID=2779161 RepID=UPI003919F3AA
MTSSSRTLDSLPDSEISVGLRKLDTLPEWLLAPLQAKTVRAALAEAVPEFASGAQTLKACKIKRMLLKDAGRWAGTYTLTIAGSGDETRTLALRGTFTPPHLRGAATPAAPARPLGAEGWRLALPALGLELEPEPPETDLIAMPQLTDADAARAMLEAGIRASTRAYAELRIASCQPEIISYKPGSRCTLRYRLGYAEAAPPTWPTEVIAKTYRKDSKGRNAYEGMAALWATPLASGATVTLAEPLAYIPEQKVMVQGPVAAEQSLEDLLKDALKADTPAAYAELHSYMIRAAAGLAALHQSGVQYGATISLGERWAELHDLSGKLYAAAPELRGAIDALLARLEALAAANPADAPVPTHGTFNPEQVLINGPHIGFIDFDDFCMAEPALDVGLFIAAIKDIGLNALSDEQASDAATRRARLARLDAIAEIFLAFYEKLAPISRERVALWQAWSYLRDALHFWIKVKPAEHDNGMLMLVDLLQQIGVFPPADPAEAEAEAQKARRRRSIPGTRYAAYVGALLAGIAVNAGDLAELLGDVLPLIS